MMHTELLHHHMNHHIWFHSLNSCSFTYNFVLKLGLNLCLITANYYIYTTGREEDSYFFRNASNFPKKIPCEQRLHFRAVWAGVQKVAFHAHTNINMIPRCIHVYSIFFVGASTAPANATLHPPITPVQSQGRLRSCNPLSILYRLENASNNRIFIYETYWFSNDHLFKPYWRTSVMTLVEWLAKEVLIVKRFLLIWSYYRRKYQESSKGMGKGQGPYFTSVTRKNTYTDKPETDSAKITAIWQHFKTPKVDPVTFKKRRTTIIFVEFQVTLSFLVS